jgi:hypothetical protein
VYNIARCESLEELIDRNRSLNRFKNVYLSFYVIIGLANVTLDITVYLITQISGKPSDSPIFRILYM